MDCLVHLERRKEERLRGGYKGIMKDIGNMVDEIEIGLRCNYELRKVVDGRETGWRKWR